MGKSLTITLQYVTKKVPIKLVPYADYYFTRLRRRKDERNNEIDKIRIG